MRKAKLSFKKRKRCLWSHVRDSYIVSCHGSEIAIIDYDKNRDRFYWYVIGGALMPFNSLSLDASARTLDGCKDEIRQHLRTLPTEPPKEEGE